MNKKKFKDKQEKINYRKKEQQKKVFWIAQRRKSHLAKENEWINKDLSQCHEKTNGKERTRKYRE